MDETELILPKNEIFTTSVRLTIMILLHTHKKVNFSELQKLLQLTPGNLDHHIKKLENVKYIRTYKQFFKTRPLTVIEITKYGKESFREYIKKIQNIINKIQEESKFPQESHRR